MKVTFFALSSFLLLVLVVSASFGQGVQRTFVSGLGNDGNPCSRTAPCRTFTQALTQTNAGGEVYVLDTAGYGAFTITQSASIVAPAGVTAGISAFSGEGIDISISSFDTVILRGLTINNQGSNGTGISFGGSGTLHVENCVVNGFSAVSANGLLFAPPGGFGVLEVKDSIFRGNYNGIHVNGGVASIEQVRLELDAKGLLVEGGAIASIRNSEASGCSAAGLIALSSTSATPALQIESCSVFFNNIGVGAESDSTGAATVRISNSTVTRNTVGLNNAGSPAVLLSRGNNTVEGNNEDTLGTIGSYSAK